MEVVICLIASVMNGCAVIGERARVGVRHLVCLYVRSHGVCICTFLRASALALSSLLLWRREGGGCAPFDT